MLVIKFINLFIIIIIIIIIIFFFFNLLFLYRSVLRLHEL